MHYVDEGGSGRPILFCHGNPTCSFLYQNVITRLRGHFRCIAVDYLRFGLSGRPEAYGYTIEEHARCVGELVDYLQLDGFITMGQDWGGPSAWPSAPHEPSASAALSSATRGSGPSTSWRQLVSRVMSTAWMQRQILLRPVRSPWFQRGRVEHLTGEGGQARQVRGPTGRRWDRWRR